MPSGWAMTAVILAGRGTNDDMGRWIADRLHTLLGSRPSESRSSA